jgi:hypothetical protein
MMGANGGPALEELPSLLGNADSEIGLDNLRYLGRLDNEEWGPVRLGLNDGVPIRDYIAAWLGAAAEEPAVMLGIERLANFVEVCGWHGKGWPHAPRRGSPAHWRTAMASRAKQVKIGSREYARRRKLSIAGMPHPRLVILDPR